MKDKYSINLICAVLKLNRSSYYEWLKAKENNKYLEVEKELIAIDNEVNSIYGRKRLTKELNARLNTNYSEQTIRRIMKRIGIVCVIRKKKNRYKKTNAEYTEENILMRDFNTTSDNQKFSTDVTEISTPEGKLYLSGIIDMHSKKILEYTVSSSNNNELVFSMINNLFDNITTKYLGNIFIQTDRGYQYTSWQFKELIKGKLIHSMNRPGHCPDNSPIESFWGILKAELYYNPKCKALFRTKLSAKNAIENYIEFYNTKRITEKGTTPESIRNNSLN